MVLSGIKFKKLRDGIFFDKSCSVIFLLSFSKFSIFIFLVYNFFEPEYSSSLSDIILSDLKEKILSSLNNTFKIFVESSTTKDESILSRISINSISPKTKGSFSSGFISDVSISEKPISSSVQEKNKKSKKIKRVLNLDGMVL